MQQSLEEDADAASSATLTVRQQRFLSPNEKQKGSPPHKQEAHPTPSIMKQSRPPDANSEHRNVLQVGVAGVNGPVWKALLIVIIQIIYTLY